MNTQRKKRTSASKVIAVGDTVKFAKDGYDEHLFKLLRRIKVFGPECVDKSVKFSQVHHGHRSFLLIMTCYIFNLSCRVETTGTVTKRRGLRRQVKVSTAKPNQTELVWVQVSQFLGVRIVYTVSPLLNANRMLVGSYCQ